MEKEILDVIPENVEKEVNIEIETVNIDKGGTSNYVDLENKPSINDVELVGNKTLDELGIQPKGGYALSEDVNAQIDELQDQIPTNVSQLTNDSGYITTETDPTVPTWVKNITEDNITSWNNKSNFNGSYNDLTDKPDIPTSTSQLINDSDYTTNAYVNGLVGEINTVLASLTTITEVTNGNN